MNITVAILLSTFNSDKYLKEQIESIIHQTYSNWHLFVRDDGSTDLTLRILSDFIINLNQKITLISDKKGNLGPCKSFEKLLEQCSAPYIMFCDHDDVWLPNKIQLTLTTMIAAQNNRPKLPILICTDLIIVDENLNLISNSMWDYMRNKPNNTSNIYELAVNNYVTGCTVMINSHAKDISLPFTKETLMHDWWIALNVCKHGNIIALTEKTILYRQHTSNALGSHKINNKYYYRKIISIKSHLKGNKDVFAMLKKIKPDIHISILLYVKIKVVLLKLFNKYK